MSFIGNANLYMIITLETHNSRFLSFISSFLQREMKRNYNQAIQLNETKLKDKIDEDRWRSSWSSWRSKLSTCFADYESIVYNFLESISYSFIQKFLLPSSIQNLNVIRPNGINLPSSRSQWREYQWETGRMSYTGARWGQIYSVGTVYLKETNLKLYLKLYLS